MTKNKYFLFLEKLRQSGVTNMYGAAPYLMVEFSLSYEIATEILVLWMKTYDRNDYKEMTKNG